MGVSTNHWATRVWTRSTRPSQARQTSLGLLPTWPGNHRWDPSWLRQARPRWDTIWLRCRDVCEPHVRTSPGGNQRFVYPAPSLDLCCLQLGLTLTPRLGPGISSSRWDRMRPPRLGPYISLRVRTQAICVETLCNCWCWDEIYPSLLGLYISVCVGTQTICVEMVYYR